MSAPPLLELREIVKRFGTTVAVDRVRLTVAAGEVHALVGENGAGKSTLLKILAGAVAPDAGDVILGGRGAPLRSPAEARAFGIALIPQDPSLVPELTVAENVLLGAERTRGGSPFLDRRAMERAASEALLALGETIDVRAKVAGLPIARRQMIEIARALAREARIIAFDEPTASLSDAEAAALFNVIRRLRADGAGILYVSHRLDEIIAIADRATVLRDGAVVATPPMADVDRATLIRWMVGHEVDETAPAAAAVAGAEILRLEGLSGGPVRDVDLVVRRGEILGLAGLVGAGRTELARLVFGADPRASGRIVLEGRAIAPRSPREAIDAGIGLLTEDRNHLGLIAGMSVTANVTLAGLKRLCAGPFLRRKREREAARRHAGRLRIKAASLDAPVEHLSGGNRQKVVLARWLETRSRLLIFDEPTAGVDVGARQEVYALIRELAAGGTGVLVISSDLDELLALCTRIVVMCEGRIAGEAPRAAATREAIMALATSHRAREATA